MTITNADLKIKSAKLLQALRAQQVYGNLFNTDFVGEIKGIGSQLQINNVVGGTVKKYIKGQKLDVETLTDGKIDFIIDQADYFNLTVDALDEAFGAGNYLNVATQETVANMTEGSERFYASKYTEIPASNITAGAVGAGYPITSATKAYDLIIDMGETMDNNNVPNVGRWLVCPNWFYNMLKKDDRVNKATATGDEIVKTGEIVTVDGMAIYKSNFVPCKSKGVEEKLIAGYAGSATRGDAIDSVEEYKHPDFFGSFAKGLHVYGGKIVRPTSMALAIINKA
ncbi:hypothetical protein [Clostridium tagluense]|uniref:hypothetical protein n=1 Tax=Clostridium tagluense TaxID=360422 RepID=UPI001CF5C389|nr:hypothetical protein [Clostridium tagluense]MCB2297045.1 hypothetical protein [Clostridium tagluense]